MTRPWLAEAYYRSAIEASRHDRVNKAIELGRESVRLAPGAGGYANFLSSAFRRKGDLTGDTRWYQESLIYANRAVELEPSGALYRSERAEVLWKLNDTDQAMEEYARARRLYPANPSYASRLAGRLVELKRYDAAASELEAVFRMEEDYVSGQYWDLSPFFEAYFLLGRIYRETGRPDQAVGAYEGALVLADRSPAVFARTRRDLTQVASTDRIAAYAHYALAETLQTMGLQDESQFQYRLAAQRDPSVNVTPAGPGGDRSEF